MVRKLHSSASPINNSNEPALHELDPSFRRVTLENDRLRQLVRDLKFHRDPVGKCVLLSLFHLR